MQRDDPFPSWFFDRDDPAPDTRFYRSPRFVTHVDEGAIAAVGDLYAELGIDGAAPRRTRVLDLMSSGPTPPVPARRHAA